MAGSLQMVSCCIFFSDFNRATYLFSNIYIDSECFLPVFVLIRAPGEKAGYK